MAELKVLISRQDVAKRVAELGEQITKDFAGQSVIFVGVLKGAAIFLADLARQVQLDSTFDFIGVSSYGNRRILSKSRLNRKRNPLSRCFPSRSMPNPPATRRLANRIMKRPCSEGVN